MIAPVRDRPGVIQTPLLSAKRVLNLDVEDIPPLTLEELRRLMIVNTGWSVGVVVVGASEGGPGSI
jgi:hypothetical protein